MKNPAWKLNNVFKHWKQLIYGIAYIAKLYYYNMKKQAQYRF